MKICIAYIIDAIDLIWTIFKLSHSRTTTKKYKKI